MTVRPPPYMGVDLDEHTRRIIGRHFHPELGSPFWLERSERLPFDPLALTGYDELIRFGPFPLDELRTRDPCDLVPLAVPRPLTGQVWESSGTTGAPKRLYYTPAMAAEREVWRRWADRVAGIEPGRTWLNALPTGPHIGGGVSLSMAHDATALVYGIDVDPRWVKRLLRQKRLAEAEAYTDHVLDQMVDVLEIQRVDYLATTPVLLLRLCRLAPKTVAALSGVRLSGTQITPQTYREFRDALDENAVLLRRYGNTMADPGFGTDAASDGDLLPYRLNYPYTTIQVVDSDDWRRVLDHGQHGQVRVTVLRDDLFLPNILERDEAIGWACPGWPTNGIANVRPLRSAPHVVEGIY